MKTVKNSIKIYLEIPPSMAAIFGTETSRWYILQREVTAGTLLSDVLTLYALNYPGFRKTIFDPAESKISTTIQITLNGVLLDPAQKMETALLEGDRITIIPAFNIEPPTH